MASTSDLLSKLQALNNQNLVDVWVPSFDGVVAFRQLSVRQQRDIIKTSMDGAIAGLTLSNVLNNIITENSTTTHAFLATDKPAIAIALRRQAFGDKYTTESGDVIDLSVFNDRKITTNIEDVVVDLQDTIQVHINTPSVVIDKEVNTHLIDSIKKTADIEVGDAVGSLYVYEISKFVVSINVSGTTVEFKQLNAQQRAQVIESLPAALNQKIVECIQQVRDAENAYLSVDGAQIVIDARLFSQ